MAADPLVILVNRDGGAASAAGGKLADQLDAAFSAVGAPSEIALVRGRDIPAAVKRAAGRSRRIVVGGGDGTIGSAAQILAGTDVELALLPVGTLNHFARDLKIPAELDRAAELAWRGRAEPVDVGDVNGRIFVNNASVGLYPFMVKDRDAIREKRGWPKWLASVPAAYGALARFRHHRLRIERGEGERQIATPLLFVGNNRYSLDSGSVGSRASLSDGLLSVYAVRRSRRLPFLWFVARALAGRVDRATDFETVGDCTALVVRSHGRHVDIALDGEVHRLRSPLQFRIRPGALRVVTAFPQDDPAPDSPGAGSNPSDQGN